MGNREEGKDRNRGVKMGGNKEKNRKGREE